MCSLISIASSIKERLAGSRETDESQRQLAASKSQTLALSSARRPRPPANGSTKYKEVASLPSVIPSTSQTMTGGLTSEV